MKRILCLVLVAIMSLACVAGAAAEESSPITIQFWNSFTGAAHWRNKVDIKLINVGYGNFISSSRIIAIIGPDSAPVKRIIQEAKEERRLIDATYGRRTRAVIISDSDHVILSAVQPETIAHRFDVKDNTTIVEEEEP